MNDYETIFIMNSDDYTESERQKVAKKIENYITDNGNISKIENLGKRRLAYEVKGHSEGHYYIIQCSMKSEKISELERIYIITDEILKFITVKKIKRRKD